MKIQKLDLIAFGPFTGHCLDLSAGAEGLHLVVGPNEAGKSSTLRALQSLLFGIDAKSPDNFVHEYKRLRIGATLRRATGETLEVIRRKGNAKTLLGPDDKTQLGDDVLVPYVGAIDQRMFEAMYGLNHQRLTTGGKEISQGNGEVGALLFAAGTGAVTPRKVQQRLLEKMAAVYAPRGKNAALNRLLSELKARQSDLKHSLLSADEWTRFEQEREAGEQRLRALEDSLNALGREKLRLDRFDKALPLLNRWTRARDELAQVASAPDLPDDFGRTIQEAQTHLSRAAVQSEEAAATVTRLREQLAGLAPRNDVLEEAERLESLRKRFGAYEKAMRDLPERQSDLRQATELCLECLRRLGRDPDLEGIDTLRVPEDQKVRIQNLGTQKSLLADRLQTVAADCEALQRRLEETERTLGNSAPTADLTLLLALLDQWQNEGDLDKQAEESRRQIKQLEEEATRALSRLPFWTGTLDDLEVLAVPTTATIEDWQVRIDELASHKKTLEEERKSELKKRQKVEADLKKIDRQRIVPTEADLELARRRRDAGWQLVLAQWQGLNPPAPTEAAEQYADHDLATAYPRAVEEADAVADRLRLEADAVAKKAAHEADRAEHDDQLQHLADELLAAETTESAALIAWRSEWKSTGIEPGSPKEMLGWRRDWQSLIDLARQLRQHRDQLAQITGKLNDYRTSLTAELGAAGATIKPVEKLRELVAQARAFVSDTQEAVREHQQLRKQAAADAQTLAGKQDVRHRATAEMEQAEREWTQSIRPLGLAPEAKPEQVNSVLATLDELFQHRLQAEGFRERIDGIEQDRVRFEEDLKLLARRVAPDAPLDNIERLANHLWSALKQAQSVQEKRTALEQQIAEQEQKQTDSAQARREAQNTLDALCQTAGCDDAARLNDIDQRSKQRRTLSQSVESLERDLDGLRKTATLEEFVQEVRSEFVDPDALSQKLQQLESQIATARAERDNARDAIQDASNKLAERRKQAPAAAIAEECQSKLAAISERAQQFAVLRMASALLEAATERHREQNQDPILTRAGELFGRLTRGAFQELRADVDEKGNHFLKGLRSGTGEEVETSGMSDGTCDQLYLALRIATLESSLDKHEPMPFIVDDILLNFDDGRASAALEVLAELSRRVQVIFFTHHKHLADIARQTVPPEMLFVHALPGRGA